MRSPPLLVDAPAPHVRRLTLDRSHVRNAIDTELAAAIRNAMSQVRRWIEEDVRAVVLTGAGNRAFCAGADLKERAGAGKAELVAQHHVLESAFETLWRCPVTLIAAVNGDAIGGGCELVLACDLAVAADTASFAQPEVGRGIIPGCGATLLLARRVGLARAKEMILTGGRFPAAAALEWGLVNRVVPAHRVEQAGLELAATVAANAPVAVRRAKAAIDRSFGLTFDEAQVRALDDYRAILSTEDAREGQAAFAEKRPATFRNR